MLYSGHKNIQDKIIENLADKKLTAKQLHEKLNTAIDSYSLQAVYDALNVLMESSTVIKHGKTFFVSEEWKKIVVKNLQRIPEEPLLLPGESKRYVFKSTTQLDKFWKHTNALLFREHPLEPIFFYEPHEFWVYNHNQSESQRLFLTSFKQEKRSAYMLIGSTTPLDNVYKETYKQYLSIHLDEKTTYARNMFITVVNDFVITTKLPLELTNNIDDLYMRHDNQQLFQDILTTLLEQDFKMSVTIENNQEAALRHRKRIAKDLYVPSIERERFQLF